MKKVAIVLLVASFGVNLWQANLFRVALHNQEFSVRFEPPTPAIEIDHWFTSGTYTVTTMCTTATVSSNTIHTCQ